jgi:hypothetical protein
MTLPKHLQFLRSTTAGNAPASLKAGEIAFNFADKILFVGDGTSFYTAIDGTQTAASTPLEGWFAVSLNDYAAIASAQSDASDALAGLADKIDKPAAAGTAGQVLSWNGTATVWVDQSADNQAASQVSYVDNYELAATTVQEALDALAEKVSVIGPLSNLSTSNTGSIVAAINEVNTKAYDAGLAAAAAQEDATAALEGLAAKQDALPAGTDGQFLSLVDGSPTWANVPTNLANVRGFADVAAFSEGAGYSTVPEAGDVVVIADAYGLLQSDPNYAILNLSGSVAEHVAVSLIASAQGQWLMLGTPGSVTQAITDVLYAVKTTTISTSGGLQGGGDISANREISIADNGVTYGKIQQATKKSILGAEVAGNVGEITIGSGLDIVDGVLVTTSVDFGTF